MSSVSLGKIDFFSTINCPCSLWLSYLKSIPSKLLSEGKPTLERQPLTGTVLYKWDYFTDVNNQSSPGSPRAKRSTFELVIKTGNNELGTFKKGETKGDG
ncbi:MAG: hypothetical protein V5A79_06470 [Candidatus Bipolaricaulota bacterium]